MNVLCRDCGMTSVAKITAECPSCGSKRLVCHDELHELALAHLDCDAFYAAIEKRDRPEWRELPLIVGGRHRGVVAACCYLARAHGVRSAMPMFQALKACPDAIVVRPDMKRYRQASEAFRAMMLKLTPLVEPLSIDEAYMDLGGTEALHETSTAALLVQLAREVEDTLGITVSVGLSYNKFLAKIASNLDKPRGFSVIGRAEASAFLADKPVEMLWGVGRALQQRLARDRITRIGDLIPFDEQTLVARYGKIGHSLYGFARGQDERSVNPEREAKSLSSEITLERDTSDLEQLRTTLWKLCETLSNRMKKAAVLGCGVTLKLKTADFRLLTRSRRLDAPSRSAEAMFRTAEVLLEGEADGRAFRLIGVGASPLLAADPLHQGELFEAASGDGPVDQVMDNIQEKFGTKAVIRGRGFGVSLQRQGPSKVE
ncbi:MAG: DNA polymerase IV [Proteobacteria bacterium]|nr:DNA polymerase IV [Pseudomonadota bacterium]